MEKFEYQAEVSRLLDLIVHSLYSHKEVFLRELVSNASDALDKMRFLSVTSPELMDATQDLCIRIQTDKEAGTITITDTGVGMSREELVESLGTIAQSGTAKFVQALKDKKTEGAAGDSNLIGQFGVGFYSAFLVADKVTVRTKGATSDKQWIWEAEANQSSYIVKEDTDPETQLLRGSSITLHLKEDDKFEYTEASRIEGLVKNYSQFISFPIYTWQELSRSKEVEEEEPAKEEGEEPKKTTKTVTEKYFDWQLVNDTKPIWMRNTKEVEKEEYNTFYKNTFKEFLDPLAYSHFTTEGEIEFRSLLYVPGMQPFNMDGQEMPKNIRLYVKRVFISDEFHGELFPRYLNFIKGVVDSNDLSLNVSREILQESRIVRIMRKRLVRKTFDMFDDISKKEDQSDYKTFWENFGKNLKLGCLEDQSSHKRIAPLLRFQSSKGEELTSLQEYVERMKEGQNDIYFLASENISSAKSAPFLEKMEKRGLEVLFLLETLDEPCLTALNSFSDKKFVDVSKEDLDFGEEKDEAKDKEVAQEMEALCDWLKQQLGDKIAKVQVSKRLESSPCVMVAGKYGYTANKEKLMRMQMVASQEIEFMRSQRVLELNPNHPIIKDLNVQCKQNPSDSRAQEMAQLLYETAHLTSGFTLENPNEFGSRVYQMMAMAVSKPQEDSSTESTKSTESVSEGVVEATEIRTEEDPWK